MNLGNLHEYPYNRCMALNFIISNGTNSIRARGILSLTHFPAHGIRSFSQWSAHWLNDNMPCAGKRVNDNMPCVRRYRNYFSMSLISNWWSRRLESMDELHM